MEWKVDPVADLVTTAGDTLYATAADTLVRLGIGTAGQVLQVNSGATAPEWATPTGGSSGLNLILTESFSAVSSITRDSLFSTTYDNYLILVEFTASANSSYNFYFRSGGSNITSSYQRQAANFSNTTLSASRSTNAGEATVGNSCGNDRNFLVLNIASPFLSQNKTFSANMMDSVNSANIELNNGALTNSSSCTGIYMFPNTGTITGKVSYYGYGK